MRIRMLRNRWDDTFIQIRKGRVLEAEEQPGNQTFPAVATTRKGGRILLLPDDFEVIEEIAPPPFGD